MAKHVDLIICIVMSAMMYEFFPLGRWMDHVPVCTVLFLGYYFLCYILTRTVCVPMFFKGGGRRVVSVLLFAVTVFVMALLTCVNEGWPLRLLDDFENENRYLRMSQERTWLFFIIVQIVGGTVGIISELNRRNARYQKMSDESVCPQPVASLQTISVRADRRNILLAISEILYIESKGNYVHLNLTDGRQLKTQTTLTSLVAQLPEDEFLRIHKSFVVARSYVSSFNSRQVCVGETALPIGRAFADGVRAWLGG